MVSEAQEAMLKGSNGAEAPNKKPRLRGRAFYESIGSPKLVLAPMVEQSEFVRCASSITPSIHSGNR